MTAVKTEYSLNGGAWVKGTAVNSFAPIKDLLIRVTDSLGDVHLFSFDGSIVMDITE